MVPFLREGEQVDHSSVHQVNPTDLKLATSTLNSLDPQEVLWLVLIGVDPKPYDSHSLRRGGATAAAARTIRVHILK